MITDKYGNEIRKGVKPGGAHEVKVDGKPGKKTVSELLAKSIPALTEKARNVIRDLDPQNDLVFMKVKTKYNEIMVAPGKFQKKWAHFGELAGFEWKRQQNCLGCVADSS